MLADPAWLRFGLSLGTGWIPNRAVRSSPSTAVNFTVSPAVEGFTEVFEVASSTTCVRGGDVLFAIVIVSAEITSSQLLPKTLRVEAAMA